MGVFVGKGYGSDWRLEQDRGQQNNHNLIKSYLKVTLQYSSLLCLILTKTEFR